MKPVVWRLLAAQGVSAVVLMSAPAASAQVTGPAYGEGPGAAGAASTVRALPATGGQPVPWSALVPAVSGTLMLTAGGLLLRRRHRDRQPPERLR